MMSNSNYSIALQRLKPVHTARPRRDRDETLVRLETVSRPRRRDRDHKSWLQVCWSNIVSLRLWRVVAICFKWRVYKFSDSINYFADKKI